MCVCVRWLSLKPTPPLRGRSERISAGRLGIDKCSAGDQIRLSFTHKYASILFQAIEICSQHILALFLSHHTKKRKFYHQTSPAQNQKEKTGRLARALERESVYSILISSSGPGLSRSPAVVLLSGPALTFSISPPQHFFYHGGNRSSKFTFFLFL